ncbi:MAG TPA: hypothetical protein VK806_08220, partial [Bacteroidia bacterium]|nr:hypothetical protein [Bacteroidia bacterium]
MKHISLFKSFFIVLALILGCGTAYGQSGVLIYHMSHTEDAQGNTTDSTSTTGTSTSQDSSAQGLMGELVVSSPGTFKDSKSDKISPKRYSTHNVEATTTTVSYYYTGSAQSFIVPSCVTSITIDMGGAQGGNSYYSGANHSSAANAGGRVQTTAIVTPGTVLTLYPGQAGANATSVIAGGAGGTNLSGDGSGGSGYSPVKNTTAYGAGGGGGASSEIWIAGTRVLVAGGGGGSGGYITCGGGGVISGKAGGSGGQNGSAGTTGNAAAAAGQGATGAAGGAGGTAENCGVGTNAIAGTAGTAASGGTGGYDDYANVGYSGGGGGGGGYAGGGGGCEAGGGGGSSGAPAVSGAFTPGVITYTGDYDGVTGTTPEEGYITITYTGPSAVVGFYNNNTTCDASPDGEITISPDGTAPYTYAWAPSGGNAITATGLSAGTYTCTVTDASGCSVQVVQSITNAGAATVTGVISSFSNDVTCTATNDGYITASVSGTGGASPFSYSWAPSGGTTNTASGLSAGTYTCTITDAGGCSTTVSQAITKPGGATITPTIIDKTNPCAGSNNGSATASGSGGVSPYTYSWAPSAGVTNPLTATPTTMSAGTYTCTVTDAGG